MTTKLEKFAAEYINTVDQICNMMLQVYSLNSKDELIKNHRPVQAEGAFYLNGKNNNYTFHGRGCRFSNDDFEIDWDFGYEELWCGLDPWKLFYYIKENRNPNLFNNGNQIEEKFNEWVVNGKMTKQHGLYYFNH